jgi:uncharacterized 2Fe-2S/4Fe-4S cluster protein (DUF4445 family)
MAHGCQEAEDIEDMTVVGNTVMHHLLLGLNRLSGACAFSPSDPASLNLKARTSASTSAHRPTYVLPVEALRGCDNVAVLLAEAPYRGEQMQLIIDIGTNGELALETGIALLASSPPGLLEGAEITFGMRAAPERSSASASIRRPRR